MANERAVEVAATLIDDIRKLIVEKNVSYDEYHAGLKFMMEVAESGEMPLLLDCFLESTVEDLNNRDSASSESCIQGPYHVPGAPELERPYVMPMREDEPGDPLIFEAAVKDPDGAPIEGAEVDMWQADANGMYSNIAPDPPEFNLRGRMTTDEDGKFEVRTVMPAAYEIPNHGPTGKLLAALGSHAWRPAHLHFRISADSADLLITQLYFKGGDYLDSDCVNGVKDALIIPTEEETGPDGSRLVKSSYEFVLAPAMQPELA